MAKGTERRSPNVEVALLVSLLCPAGRPAEKASGQLCCTEPSIVHLVRRSGGGGCSWREKLEVEAQSWSCDRGNCMLGPPADGVMRRCSSAGPGGRMKPGQRRRSGWVDRSSAACLQATDPPPAPAISPMRSALLCGRGQSSQRYAHSR
nr:hypothetical protein CFP56_58121 [Quercus suber]